MESDSVDFVSVGIVVLQESLTSDVPNLDGLVRTSTGNASTVWVEAQAIYWVLVVIETLYQCFLSDIPELDCSVVWSTTYKPSIWWELTSPYPISMSTNCEHKLSVINSEDLECFVIRSRKQELPIRRESHALHWCRVGFDHLRMPWDWVSPNSYSLIGRARSNCVSVRRHTDVINRAFVAYETVGPERRLEVPHHESTINRRWNNLFQIWIEGNSRDWVFVPFEGTLQGRISHLGKEFWVLTSLQSLVISSWVHSWERRVWKKTASKLWLVGFHNFKFKLLILWYS